MPNFDNSRRIDMQKIDDKLHDKKTTRRGRRLLEISRAAILRQERDPYVRTLRDRLLRATQANDAHTVAKITEQLHAYDRQHAYDQLER